MERVVDKIRELEARVRALERLAEDDRTLDDIRSSISMLADSMANIDTSHQTSANGSTTLKSSRLPKQSASAAKRKCPAVKQFTALTDPRFRVL